VGTSEVTLRFADELTATVSVVVVAEGEDITSLEEPKEDEKKAEED
jgi:hypothetical protein